MTVTRRRFLGTALGLGSDIAFNDGKAAESLLEKLADFSVGGAEAAQQKGIEALTQEDIIYDINRARKKLDWGRSQKGYDDIFADFESIYTKSMAKYGQTRDTSFLKTAVVSAMYAGRAILDASSLNNGKKRESLDRALSSYGNAIHARQMLGTDKSYLYKRNLIDLQVADENLIRKRTSEVYEELVRITQGREKDAYLRSLIETYKRLVNLTGGTERFNYQSRIQDLSPQIGKINK